MKTARDVARMQILKRTHVQVVIAQSEAKMRERERTIEMALIVEEGTASCSELAVALDLDLSYVQEQVDAQLAAWSKL